MTARQRGPEGAPADRALAPGQAQRALLSTLRSARRRLHLRRAVEAVARALPLSLALAALLVATLRLAAPHLLPVLPLATVVGQAALLATAVLLAATLLSLARFSDLQVALLLDRAFDTRELATTAVALRGHEEAAHHAQLALAALPPRPASAAFPWRRLPWRLSTLAATLLALAFVAPRLASRTEAAQSTVAPEVAVAATALAAEAEKLSETLAKKDAPESARRALEKVQDEAESLARKPMPREQAALELRRLEQELDDASRERRAAETDSLHRALSSLEQAQLSREAARAASEGDAEKLEQELKALAQKFESGTSFDARESKRMAMRLREAAEALKETRPELAAQLDALAQALEKGDAKEAARLAKELSESAELRELVGDMAVDQTLRDAKRLVQQALASMGKARADEEAKEGEGTRDGAATKVAGQVPTDWGVGTTNEADPDRPLGAGHQSNRQSTETSRWREAYQALADSTRLDDATGRATRVSGALGQGDMVAVPTRTQSTGPESARAPLVRLPPSYEQAREEAFAREQVPAGYEAPVKKYFLSLEGEKK